ncbi:MAG: VanZ family protein [Corynebacterium sp.]|nr:VanZ family protein [Corynebacterium sp.]
MARHKLRFLHVALILCVVAILSLTLGKTWVTIGGLWKTGAHERRSLDLIPFLDFFTATTWFAPTFNLVGNIAMFVPFGILLAFSGWFRKFRRNVVALVAAVAFAFSFSLESIQFLLKIGYTDTGDLISNTLGAALGARSAVEMMRKASRLACQLMVYACCLFAATVFFLLDLVPALLEILPKWLQ